MRDYRTSTIRTRSQTVLRRQRIERMCVIIEEAADSLTESDWNIQHLVDITVSMPTVHDSIGTILATFHMCIYRHQSITPMDLLDQLALLQLQSDVMVTEVYAELYRHNANTVIQLAILYNLAKDLPHYTDPDCLQILDRMTHFVPFLNLFKREFMLSKFF